MTKSNGKQKLQEICCSISRVHVISAKVQKANFWVDSLNYRCTDSRLSAGKGPSCRIFQSNSTINSSLYIWVSLYIEILDAKSRNNSGIVFGGSPIRQILDYDVFGRHLRVYLFAFLSIEGSKYKADRTHYTRWPSNAFQEMSTSLNFATMTNNKWAWAKRKWFTFPFSYLSVILESPGFLSSGQWRFASCIKTKQRVIL